MENINVTLGIDNEAVIQIANLVEEQLKDSNNIVETIEEVIANTDFDETITNWMDDNFSIKDHLDNVDMCDYIDYDEVAEKIDIDYKIKDEIGSFDYSDVTRDLLESYEPSRTCRTGDAFTQAIERAVLYLLSDGDLAAKIEEAIIESKQSEIISTRVDELYKSRLVYLEIENRRKFQQEIIEYANAVEEAKKLIDQSENVYQKEA